MTISPDCVPDAAASADPPPRPHDFDAFFRANYARTVRLAHLLTGSDTVAQDLAQDAFGRVFPRFGDLLEPVSYLRVATVNVCRTWHRTQRRELDRLRRHGAPRPTSGGEPDVMADALVALPYRQRAVLVLRYWLDVSERDIAAALDCRPGTVKSLHARALDSLRKDLA